MNKVRLTYMIWLLITTTCLVVAIIKGHASATAASLMSLGVIIACFVIDKNNEE